MQNLKHAIYFACQNNPVALWLPRVKVCMLFGLMCVRCRASCSEASARATEATKSTDWEMGLFCTWGGMSEKEGASWDNDVARPVWVVLTYSGQTNVLGVNCSNANEQKCIFIALLTLHKTFFNQLFLFCLVFHSKYLDILKTKLTWEAKCCMCWTEEYIALTNSFLV